MDTYFFNIGNFFGENFIFQLVHLSNFALTSLLSPPSFFFISFLQLFKKISAIPRAWSERCIDFLGDCQEGPFLGDCQEGPFLGDCQERPLPRDEPAEIREDGGYVQLVLPQRRFCSAQSASAIRIHAYLRQFLCNYQRVTVEL